MRMKWRIGSATLAMTAVGMLAMGGCASNGTVVRTKIPAAEEGISEARNAEAIVYAPVELKMAEEKLEGARKALAAEEYDKANRLVDQAKADADYAQAKSSSEKTKKMAEQLRESVEKLRQEIERMPATK